MRHTDFLLPLALFGTILLLVVPVPAAVLDLLLAGSIGVSLLILLVILYIKDPPEFSGFPTLLLAVTLFRLGLNVASTRLILSDGFAGDIIEAFGHFVVRGNFVVGGVIFLILVVINFVVITKGAGRIAEVAARFTLDAMPGKQMAIDAELNAGLIDEATARARRLKVQREADFYGAMDGSSKFVRGDAVAAILITLINVLGGFAIGILQKGMPIVEALQKYTLLSIGDGLVSQVPALIISVAAGILATRGSDDAGLGAQIGRQLTGYPRAVVATAGALAVFALMPGLPFLPFLALAGAAGWTAHAMARRQQRSPSLPPGTAGNAAGNLSALPDGKKGSGGSGAQGGGTTPGEAAGGANGSGAEDLSKLIVVDIFAVELGYGLLGLADRARGGDLLDRVTGVRKNLARELGIIVPPIVVRDSVRLESDEYRFLLRGKPIAQGRILAGRSLAMNVTNSPVELKGVPTVEPVFGLQAIWIADDQKKTAEINGYTVVDPAAVLITHLAEVLKRHAHLIVGRQDVQTLVDHLKASHPTLVAELLPDLVNVGLIQRVLGNLLKEGVSIRNLPVILECVGDFAPLTKNPDDLSEQVRRRLGVYFVGEYESAPGVIRALTLDPRLEQQLAGRVQRTAYEIGLSIDPHLAAHLLGELSRRAGEMSAQGLTPILVTAAELRLPFKRFFEPSLPRLVVLSYQELPAATEIQNVGAVAAPATAGGGMATPPRAVPPEKMAA